jgi:hypothetical protein
VSNPEAVFSFNEIWEILGKEYLVPYAPGSSALMKKNMQNAVRERKIATSRRESTHLTKLAKQAAWYR